MLDVAIDFGSDHFNNVTLEVITGNSDCQKRLCMLAGTAIEDKISFVDLRGVKLLIGFKSKAALEASRTHLFSVLGNFSGEEYKAKFWNAL